MRRNEGSKKTAHILAVITVIGFYAVVFASLFGNVNIKDPTVASFLGIVTGYIAADLDYIFGNYFGRKDKDKEKDKDSEQDNDG